MTWQPDWNGRRIVRHRLSGELWLGDVQVAISIIQWLTPTGWEKRWLALFKRFGEDQIYYVPVLSQSFQVGASPGSNETYTSDATWNNANNKIETIGAGASGGAHRDTLVSRDASGGGGGAYNSITNFTFATPGTTTATFRIGLGGAAIVQSTSADTSGNDGGDTWFNDTAFPTTGSNKVGAKGGVHGTAGAATQTGGAGGASGSNYPVGGNSGGRGGTATTNNGIGTGGGGAGGPSGVGGNGGDSSTTNGTTAGGQGDATSGGTGGGAGNNNGNAGTELGDSIHGCGGGGGGNSVNGTTTAGSGGLYGAGGGGATGQNGAGTVTSGAGKNGIIVLTWTPAPTGPAIILMGQSVL
jgi:hypothetical protein